MPPATPNASYGARHAMPIDQYISQIGKVDEFLEGLFPGASDEEIREAAEQVKRIHATAARLFATADGRELLEWLCDLTLRRSKFIVAPGMSPGVGYALAALQEGKQQVVWMLICAIAMGRSERPPTREGPTS